MIARLDAGFRRLWAHGLGHVTWLAAAAVLVSRLPSPWAAAGLGVLFGLRAGKVWRDRLRVERDEARELVNTWNSSAVRDDLAEVGNVAPERRPAVLYQQTDTETVPPVDLACGRCGTAVTWVNCDICGGDGCFVDGSDCPDCSAEGGWWMCRAPIDWCSANPLPGREATSRGAVVETAALRPAGEVWLG